MSLAVSALLFVGGYILLADDEGSAVKYQTALVVRGDLTVTVTATGVLEPVNQVEVGTEISGTVESVEVDFNYRVKKGQVLARLDTEQLEAKFRQSQASLALAKAKVKEAEATIVETRNKLRRAKELQKKGLCSQEDCDAAEATFARAEAVLASASAQVTQAQAQLDADKTALSKAVIHAPINGIVLKRSIEPGQTVAASFQTPVLFTLAENLTQMELIVAVDEADVGQVKEGQNATFTVDAYPNRAFPAEITQVRFAPQTVEGVVTYETILSVDNSDLSLRPGMTATAEIIVNEIPDAVLVPNAALRFKPPSTQSQSRTGPSFSLLPRRPHSTSTDKRKDMSAANSNRQRVWVLREGNPVAVTVEIGASDSKMSQVLSGEIEPGQKVLVDYTRTRS
jgi:HlyD family secretion protein